MAADITITCNRCGKDLYHQCDREVQEAVERLLAWVPEDGGEPAVVKAFEKSQYTPGPNDREMPFFGSQCWSYSILGQEDARTFHALLHNLVRALGLDPHALEQDILKKRHAELEAREKRKRR